VTVLEARNRVGGRINTEVMGTTGGGIRVDMGASWIHGIGPGAGEMPEYRNMENPIYTLAYQNNISTVPTWYSESETIEKTYWWKGISSPLNEAKFTNMSDAIMAHI
jgi:phytoene dehydrogenase-like protein